MSDLVITRCALRIAGYALRAALLPAALLLAACAVLPAGAPEAQPTQAPPPAFTLAPSAATLAPAATLPPSAAPEPTPSPTAAPRLARLTEPGCCVQPFWSRDGSLIFFIDKPAPEAPSGLYSADPARPGEPPQFFSDQPGYYSADMSLLVYPQNGLAVVENLYTGDRYEVNTSGNAPALSPDGRRMLWQVGGGGGPINSRRSDLYVANVDGSEARYVTTFIGGGTQAWFPDSRRVLAVSRLSLDVPERSLLALDLGDGSQRALAQAERISTVRLSPGGSWAAFLVTFSANPGQDGIWLARTDGSELKRLEQYGAYQWRDDERLLLVPLTPGSPSHALWEIDAASGQARPLTDPAQTPFRIANGDWSVSPDGSQIVFVNAADRALWLLQIPR